MVCVCGGGGFPCLVKGLSQEMRRGLRGFGERAALWGRMPHVELFAIRHDFSHSCWASSVLCGPTKAAKCLRRCSLKACLSKGVCQHSPSCCQHPPCDQSPFPPSRSVVSAPVVLLDEVMKYLSRNVMRHSQAAARRAAGGRVRATRPGGRLERMSVLGGRKCER
jgi:hypothetical protein